jgi:hypothetical protein
MPCKQQSDILKVYQTQFFAKFHTSKSKNDFFLNIIWKAMISKGMNAMSALSKFLVLLMALILLASHANAFTSLSSVAGNQVRINHLTRLQQPISNPKNEPNRGSRTNQMNGFECFASKQPFTNQQCCAL